MLFCIELVTELANGWWLVIDRPDLAATAHITVLGQAKGFLRNALFSIFKRRARKPIAKRVIGGCVICGKETHTEYDCRIRRE